jgi:hypothetical protein
MGCHHGMREKAKNERLRNVHRTGHRKQPVPIQTYRLQFG